MLVETLSSYGDPNGKVFGVAGEINSLDDGDVYVKSGSDSQTLNFGWTKLPQPSPTTTPTFTPSITPTRTPVGTRPVYSGVVPLTPTPTPSVTKTQYPIYTRTPTPTATPTPSITPSMDATPLPTVSVTPTNAFTLTISSTGNGTVWPYVSGTVVIQAGTVVSLDADPTIGNDYYEFVTTGITGAVSSSTVYVDGIYGTCQFTMPSNNCSIAATFTEQIKTLTTSVSGSGAISVSPSSPYNYGTNVSLTAISSSTSVFSNWVFGGASNPSDGSTFSTSSNVYMTDDRSAAAYFSALRSVTARVNDDGSWSVNFKNKAAQIVTLNGSVDPSLRGSSVTVGCGTEVYSGGSLSNISCTG